MLPSINIFHGTAGRRPTFALNRNVVEYPDFGIKVPKINSEFNRLVMTPLFTLDMEPMGWR